jgi:hypothetical protein
MPPSGSKEAAMQKQKMGKTKLLIIVALLYPGYTLAQIGGERSGGGAHGSSMGGGTTTGIASDQAHISPPGTNSLGTANSAGLPGGETVGANMEPKDSRRIDAEIRDENSRVDSKINSICKGC